MENQNKKNTLRRIVKFLKNPYRLFVVLTRRGWFKSMNDERYLKLYYRGLMGEKLNLKNPQTFNEKLQWLKLYDRKQIYTTMVDKYEVKKYVADLIGEEYIIPTLGVWDKFEDIEFDSLPEQFVLKTTHDSGGVIICKDKSKFDFAKAKEKIVKSLKTNYYYGTREWPYKHVKPRIIAEKYIEDSKLCDLMDYKFMCFNGVVKCSFVCSGRNTEERLHVTFFDREWNLMNFERAYPMKKEGFPKPELYEEIIALAEKLSRDIPFVRVDFYQANRKIYFGELTFYPGGGFESFSPEIWDRTLGDWIKLPKKRG